jgi:hypothetical protein
MRVRRSLALIAGLTACVLVAGVCPAMAVTAAQKCEAALELALGKYALCHLEAESRFTKDVDAEAFADALTSCATKAVQAFGTANRRWGSSCPAVEPEILIAIRLQQCTVEAAAAAGGALFPACGDGVINVAGEKCDGEDFGHDHCVSLGFRGGLLRCTDNCRYDVSACVR